MDASLVYAKCGVAPPTKFHSYIIYCMLFDYQ